MAVLSVVAGALLAAVGSNANYLPEGVSIFPRVDTHGYDHWDTSTKLTVAHADMFVKSNVDAGKTVFIRWIGAES